MIQCAYNVRTHLTAGLIERVYQKALMVELKEHGIHAAIEMPINRYITKMKLWENSEPITIHKKTISHPKKMLLCLNYRCCAKKMFLCSYV